MATKKPLLRSLIGRRCRLPFPVTTRGGETFAVGEKFRITSVWRGRFTLRSGKNYIRQMPRGMVEVLDA